MRDKPVILVVDDEPQHIELLEAYLLPQGYEIVKATNGEEALEILSDNPIDLILLDVMMPGMDGFEVIRRVRQDQAQRLLPIILVTVLQETEDRIKGIEAGCDDFISYPVDKLELLARVRSLLRVKAYNDLMRNYQKELEFEVTRRTEEIKHVLENLQQDIIVRKRAEENLRESEERYKALFDRSLDLVYTMDIEGRFIDANQAALNRLGYTRPEIRSLNFASLLSEDQLPLAIKILEEIRETGIQKTLIEFRLWRKDGTPVYVETQGSSVISNGTPIAIQAIARDITARKQAERDLEGSEAKMRSILDNIGIGVALISPNMEVLDLNHRMREWFPAIDPGQHPICYRAFNDPPREEVCDYCPTHKTLQDGLVHEATAQTPRAGGVQNYRIVSSPILNASGEVTAAIEMVEDITEKLSLESQVRQAQKMEAVGRLAGGVAHDFNNMLGIILGYTQMALDGAGPGTLLHDNLTEIQEAAQRSVELTRQLLAFARKQTIDPQVLDLNETVEGMLKMLRRLIGEDINLAWQPESGLWPVKMDLGQVEQILANLCVNARDAIKHVGKVTIETGNAVFDQAYCADHPGFVPGEYTLLAVSDDGCGMDKGTLDHIFEPFFTTKEVGQGTGLGLATVYGIVKQNNGFINVYSEPGKGTTFKVYLARQAGQAVDIQEESEGALPLSQGETVLVVEDEVALLKLAGGILNKLGYIVLTASAPGKALRLVEQYTGEIHLLMADVILPEMNGRDLAERIKAIRPTMKCLFMSGYTADVIAHRGMLDEGVQFIPKPFSVRELAAKVRTVLEKRE